VYRTGLPLEGFSVAAPTETNYVDVCIDSAGLMLEEVYVAGASVLQHRTAISVDAAPALTDVDFAIEGEPKAIDEGGSELEEIDADEAPVEGYWTLEPPEGYVLQARYVLRSPDETAATDDADDASVPSSSTTSTSTPTDATTSSVASGGPTTTASGSASAATTTDASTTTVAGATTTTVATEPVAVVETYIDVYVNGTNTLIVHQGPTAGEPTTDASSAPDAPSETFGTVKIAAGLSGSTVLIHPESPADWFIELRATMPRAQLSDLANTLRSDGQSDGQSDDQP
jgi:hypothetical protein